MSTTSTTDAVVHFRVKSEQLDQMRNIAASEHRSLSGEVRQALAEHIERSGHDEDEAP
jgi:hypothetical protein